MCYIDKFYLAFSFVIVLFFASCDDSTGTIGLFPDGDNISNSISLYEVTTQSLKMDSVEANSSYSYLGNITDPETGSKITASYAAQYYCFEGYDFPNKELMCAVNIDENGDTTSIEHGVIRCDSCELRVYFDDYYGDKNNPMKLQVYALDPDKLLEEDSTYYTNTDLTQFLVNAKPIAERVFTPMDYNLTESELKSSTHSHNIPVRLDTIIGKQIIEKYYENPNNFKDSYSFIRNVCPGFYFTVSSGEGTMLSVYAGTFNIYFHYSDSENSDSVFVGLSRFAATPEVIQSTHFDNSDMNDLINQKDVTFLKTPAGICTEMTLPVDEIFGGEHSADSVSLATITLTRYNKDQDDYQLGTPSELLMVRKQNMHSFFENHEVSDSRTSYTTSFNSTYNSYTFDNICRLLAYTKHEKNQAVIKRLAEQGITNYTEAQFANEEQIWMEENPDWNKVVLIPVITSSNTSGNETSVTHDLGLNSIRLVGGDTKLTMQVVYSKFKSN